MNYSVSEGYYNRCILCKAQSHLTQKNNLGSDFVVHVLTRLKHQGTRVEDLGTRPEELLNALRDLSHSLSASARHLFSRCDRGVLQATRAARAQRGSPKHRTADAERESHHAPGPRRLLYTAVDPFMREMWLEKKAQLSPPPADPP